MIPFARGPVDDQGRPVPNMGFTPREVEAILAPYYERGERLVKLALVFHYFLSLWLATFYGTWTITLPVAASAVALFFFSAWRSPRSFFTRCIAGVSLQTFVALHIYQLHGLPEMHFFFFTAFALMIALYDWRAMWPGTILIMVQYTVFAILTNSGVQVYFFPEPYVEPTKLCFHFSIACMMVGLCGYWTTEMRWQILRQTWQTREIQRLANIAENTRDSIALTDRNGRITWVNQGFSRLTGYASHEVVGQDLINLLHGSSTELSRVMAMREAFSSCGVFACELCLQAKNGQTYWVARSVTPLPEGTVAPGTFIVLDMEVTEHKEAEAARLQLERKLQQTQKLESLGVLAGGIAHDFNNLLTSILGYATLIEMDLTADSELRNPLKQIEVASRRAADLCKQMLAYAGKGRFLMQAVDLTQLVRDTSDLIHASVSRRAVLTFCLTPNLPPVRADISQMRQVLMNLVMNAAEAIGEQEGAIVVSTGVMHVDRASLADTYLGAELPVGDYTYLEVKDTGCGMDEATRARIFEPFFTTKFAGRGLGLAAVLGIVRGHRGSVKVETAAGYGSTFRLYFPCQALPRPTTPPSHSREVLAPSRTLPETRTAITAKQPNHVLPRSSAGTVLVVDDEDAVRTLATHILELQGYQIVSARDGQDGIDKFEAHSNRIRLVLLDLTMPRLDGEQVLRRLHQTHPELPVILMSGYTEEELTPRFADLRLSGFLQKPFTTSDILAKVKHVLETAPV